MPGESLAPASPGRVAGTAAAGHPVRSRPKSEESALRCRQGRTGDFPDRLRRPAAGAALTPAIHPRYWAVGPWDAFRFVAEAPEPTRVWSESPPRCGVGSLGG